MMGLLYSSSTLTMFWLNPVLLKDSNGYGNWLSWCSLRPSPGFTRSSLPSWLSPPPSCGPWSSRLSPLSTSGLCHPPFASLISVWPLAAGWVTTLFFCLKVRCKSYWVCYSQKVSLCNCGLIGENRGFDVRIILKFECNWWPSGVVASLTSSEFR